MPCPLAEALEAQRLWPNKAQYADAEQKLHVKVSANHAIIFTAAITQISKAIVLSQWFHCVEHVHPEKSNGECLFDSYFGVGFSISIYCNPSNRQKKSQFLLFSEILVTC